MTRPLRISDHAFVRFLERAGGYDIERTRATLADSLARAAAAAGLVHASRYTIIADGLAYIVRDGVVVSILPARGRARR